MVDSEYSPVNFKPLKIKIGAIIKLEKCSNSFLFNLKLKSFANMLLKRILSNMICF